MWTLIDNYDSFTYNLYQALCKLGAEVRVVRNDVMTAAQAGEGSEGIILSPGPGTPADAGICAEAVRLFAGKVPRGGNAPARDAAARRALLQARTGIQRPRLTPRPSIA